MDMPAAWDQPAHLPFSQEHIPLRLPSYIQFPSVPSQEQEQKETEPGLRQQRSAGRRAAAARLMTGACRKAAGGERRSAPGMRLDSAKQAEAQRQPTGDVADQNRFMLCRRVSGSLFSCSQQQRGDLLPTRTAAAVLGREAPRQQSQRQSYERTSSAERSANAYRRDNCLSLQRFTANVLRTQFQ